MTCGPTAGPATWGRNADCDDDEPGVETRSWRVSAGYGLRGGGSGSGHLDVAAEAHFRQTRALQVIHFVIALATGKDARSTQPGDGGDMPAIRPMSPFRIPRHIHRRSSAVKQSVSVETDIASRLGCAHPQHANVTGRTLSKLSEPHLLSSPIFDQQKNELVQAQNSTSNLPGRQSYPRPRASACC